MDLTELIKKQFPKYDPALVQKELDPYMSNYDVNISDTTVPMQGRPESLPSQVGGDSSIPEIPPTTGATRSWEEPLAAPIPPPIEPPKPPLEAPKQTPGTSKTPPEGSNPLDMLLQASSPDQDARNKMLESEKSKHMWGALPTALGGIGDAIGNAAAAYGGRGASGTAEKIAAGLEKGEVGRKTQFEENLKNDPKSQISEHYRNVLAMMMNTKPTDPKIANLSASYIATTLPEIEKYITHKLAREQVAATREQAQASKELALSEKQSQFDSRQWERLGSHVNQLEAGSRKALGVAATANMRADRLLETARDPKASPQDIQNMIADLQGVYKGGVPDQIMLRHGNYPSLVQELAKIKGIITNTPAAANSPEIVNRLVKVTRDIKAVDNMVISSNLGINKVIFRDLINKDPERWEELVTQVMGATQTPSEAQGTTPAATTPGTSTTTNQPTQIGRFKVTVR